MPRTSRAVRCRPRRVALQRHGQTPMSNPPRPRGRPKGTGINDRDTLQAISKLLARNTDLKPTTAIHMAGITDPSGVRRLRDKLKSIPLEAPSMKLVALPPRGNRAGQRPKRNPARRQTSPGEFLASTPATSAAATPSHRPPPPQDVSAAASYRQPASAEPRRVEPAEALIPPPPQQLPQPSASNSATPADPGIRQPLADPQLEALRLAAEAAGAMSRLYLHCMNFAAQTNPYSLALRSQTVMSQWIIGMLNAQIRPTPGTNTE